MEFPKGRQKSNKEEEEEDKQEESKDLKKGLSGEHTITITLKLQENGRFCLLQKKENKQNQTKTKKGGFANTFLHTEAQPSIFATYTLFSAKAVRTQLLIITRQ